MIEIVEFRSLTPGPRLLVFGAIHGNEVCGPRALGRLRQELASDAVTLRSGTLTFVPVCNPEAFRLGQRLCDKNLNRIFEPHTQPTAYEHRLANQLAPMLESADYFLDLHSMTSKGEPFVFLNREVADSRRLCRALGARIIMTGWPELYASSGPDEFCCTQTYADRLGIPNALIECGTHGDPAADEVAYRAVRGALAELGMADAMPNEKPDSRIPPTAEVLRLVHVHFRAFIDDALAREWNTFDPVAAGELIGWSGPERRELRSPVDGVIVFPNPSTPLGTELFYLAVRES